MMQVDYTLYFNTAKGITLGVTLGEKKWLLLGANYFVMSMQLQTRGEILFLFILIFFHLKIIAYLHQYVTVLT